MQEAMETMDIIRDDWEDGWQKEV